jgi:hypothetical protein
VGRTSSSQDTASRSEETVASRSEDTASRSEETVASRSEDAASRSEDKDAAVDVREDNVKVLLNGEVKITCVGTSKRVRFFARLYTNPCPICIQSVKGFEYPSDTNYN